MLCGAAALTAQVDVRSIIKPGQLRQIPFLPVYTTTRFLHTLCNIHNVLLLSNKLPIFMLSLILFSIYLDRTKLDISHLADYTIEHDSDLSIFLWVSYQVYPVVKHKENYDCPKDDRCSIVFGVMIVLLTSGLLPDLVCPACSLKAVAREL